MPPKHKITKEVLLAAALDLVRQRGADALNARELAKSVGASTQPIFSHFASMQSLREEVIAAAYKCYLAYQKEGAAGGRYPPYKASGMSYIRFASEESMLFKLLFMRDRRKEAAPEGFTDGSVALISATYGMPKESAEAFHFAMWTSVHGIATMLATGYLALEEETVSALLTTVFRALKSEYLQEES